MHEKYSPLQSEFLKKYVVELEQYGFIRKNDRSRWACAAVPARKSGSIMDFRITNDYRPVNSMTIPIAGTTPNLNTIT